MLMDGSVVLYRRTPKMIPKKYLAFRTKRARCTTPYTACTPNSTVDGVIEEAEATGVATSVLHARSAFDVFTASDAANVARYTAEKDRKYREAVQAAGDAFFTVPFTPSGTPYPAAMPLLEKIVHTGDKLPMTVGRDAPRFIHDSTSYVTATHTNHTIHACTAAAMRAATVAMRKYARTRATNHGLLANTMLNPPVVPIPTMVP
jgi:hypothetical protein